MLVSMAALPKPQRRQLLSKTVCDSGKMFSTVVQVGEDNSLFVQFLSNEVKLASHTVQSPNLPQTVHPFAKRLARQRRIREFLVLVRDVFVAEGVDAAH